MAIHSTRFHALQAACFVLLAAMLVSAQVAGADYSGMYSFLRDGEFVQVTVEDQGRVTGFVSRYGDSESDRGIFWITSSSQENLKAINLRLRPRRCTVSGSNFMVWSSAARARARSDEAYYVLKGTLFENTTDEAKKTSSRSLEVALKSFPQDMGAPPAGGK